MKIITHTCPECGTVVAGNVLERSRSLVCPGLDCNREIRFADLSSDDQEYLKNNRNKLQID
jgi:hypothetical protein